MNSNSHQQRVKLIQSETKRLKRFLATLPADAWSKQSACDKWEIKDVVAHITSVNEYYVDMITRGLQGQHETPEGRPDPGTIKRSDMAEGSAERSILFRQKIEDSLFPRFVSTNDLLNDLFVELKASDWERKCYHLVSTLSVWDYSALRLFELALHGWDIRSVIQSDAHIAKECLPAIVEFMPIMFNWLFQPSTKLTSPVRFRFEISGVVSKTYDIVVEGDKAHLATNADESADIAFRCDPETYILVMTGRRNLGDAVTKGNVIRKGNESSVEKFDEYFGGA